MHIFQNLERDSIFEPRDKKRLQPFLTAILDGLLCTQAKMRFFKGVF